MSVSNQRNIKHLCSITEGRRGARLQVFFAKVCPGENKFDAILLEFKVQKWNGMITSNCLFDLLGAVSHWSFTLYGLKTRISMIFLKEDKSIRY